MMWGAGAARDRELRRVDFSQFAPGTLEAIMLNSLPLRYFAAALALTVASLCSATAVDSSGGAAKSARAPKQAAAPSPTTLDASAVAYKLPDQIEWKGPAGGPQQAVLVGDPMREGSLYIELVKWTPHHMSHPHFHPNDRYITVLSGTWWVGTGTKYDPDKTVPMPAGSFVTDLAKGIHYDGAKDEQAIIEIVGMGPATITPAETK
jgi:hypothetical protein